MKTFEIGDRVKCTMVFPGSSTQPTMIGKKGTVLDHNDMPDVKMDDPSLNGANGHVVFYQEELELIEWF
jgi:hypothetical protein